jgi:transposase-like protein
LSFRFPLGPSRRDIWHLDEVVVTIGGKKHWLWRASAIRLIRSRTASALIAVSAFSKGRTRSRSDGPLKGRF